MLSSLYRIPRHCGTRISVFLCLVAMAISALNAEDARADVSPFDKQIEVLAAQFEEAYQSRAGDPYQKAIEELNTGYVSALRKSLEKTSADRKDGVEKAIAFINEHGMPQGGRATDTADIRKLRSVYTSNQRRLWQVHEEEKQSLLSRYADSLGAFQSQVRNQQDAELLKEEQQKVQEWRSNSGLLFAKATPTPSRPRIAPKAQPLPPLRPGSTRVVLEDFPMVRQDRMYCGPASAAMVAQYFGRWVDQDVIAQLTSESSEKRKGTHDKDLADALGCLGFEAQPFDLNALNKGRSKSQTREAIQGEGFDLIKREIDAGRPLFFSFDNGANGHYNLIIGYEIYGEHRAVIHRDPIRPDRPIISHINALAKLWPRTDVGPGNSVLGIVVKETPPRQPIGNTISAIIPPRLRLDDSDLAPFQSLLEEMAALPVDELTTFRLDDIATKAGDLFLKRCNLVREDKSSASTRASRFSEEASIPILFGELAARRPGIVLCDTKEGGEMRWVVAYDRVAKTLTYRAKSLGNEERTVSFDDFADDWVRKNGEGNIVTDIVYAAFPAADTREDAGEGG